ncbi:MAG: glycosyltransferase [Candidatus Taylorbacteria bacterium]|nr:glycosyltransferase [Candidatus Taylorbacteria bacterium]
MNKIPTVEVVIPAYNEEKNIKVLLSSILNQKNGSFLFKKITVMADGTDNTANFAKEIGKNSSIPITVIHNPERRGKYVALNQYFPLVESDIVIHCDGDVLLKDDAVKVIVENFEKYPNVTMIWAKCVLLPPLNYIERVNYVGYEIFSSIRNRLGEKAMKYYACGRLYAARGDFYKTINIKPIIEEDAYVFYLSAEKYLKSLYVDKAIAFYRGAGSLKEYLIQAKRVRLNSLSKYFDKELLKKWESIKFTDMAMGALSFLPKNPFYVISYVFLWIFGFIVSKFSSTDINWYMISSSKTLIKE